MENKFITIIPVMESGKGSALRVKAFNNVYMSEYSNEPLTAELVKSLYDGMKSNFDKKIAGDIDNVFNQLLDSITKMEEEEKYREEHPEEFIIDIPDEDNVIISENALKEQA